MFEFASALWLLAIPLPWAIEAIARRRRKPHHAQPGLLHPHTELLARLARESSAPRSQSTLWLLGCVLLILALARPQWILIDPADYPGRDLMLAVDASASMRAQDFYLDNQAVSRLDMVKRIVGRVLQDRYGDRAGLIVFADDAFLVTPVTSDLERVRALLADIKEGIAGDKTALGNAVTLAVKRLRDRPPEARILVLLTDGANTAGEVSPSTAVALAREYGVRIHAVGIGSDNKVPYPRGPMQSPALTEIPLDETLLREMAAQTGGHYYRADRTDELEKIIADINRLETIDITEDHAAARREWHWLPLIGGLTLLLWAQRRTMREVLP